MTSKYFLIAMMLVSSAVYAGIPFTHGNLKVDGSGRYLEHDDGTPFLYMGDTAWEMLSRLTYEEACAYMDNRVGKGINVIQTVLLSELAGIRDTTAAGVTQLINGDVCSPNPLYLAHADSVLAYAEQIGLYLAILPTWGDKVDKQWGNGPEIFNEHNAEEYGRILGRRWASRPNIIWIIGGDRGGGGKNRAVWNAMARSIKSEDKVHLMTYHPHGEHSSSMWFHDEDWLDFNMIQTGHCQQGYDIYRRMMLHDMALKPVKPVRKENHGMKTYRATSKRKTAGLGLPTLGIRYIRACLPVHADTLTATTICGRCMLRGANPSVTRVHTGTTR